MNTRLLLIAIFVLVVDLIWVGKIMYNNWNTNIQNIQGSVMKPNGTMAVLSYICLIIGLLYFVQSDLSINETNYVTKSLVNGAIFGLVVYGVYDFTNLALFKNWNLSLAISDILWGMFICSVVPLVANYVYFSYIKA
jgi:uncharacterized membrane protein